MSINGHDKVNRGFALLGVSLVSAAAFAMNAKYSMSLGSDTFEQYLMLMVSLGIDIFKFFGLSFIALAFLKRKWFKAIAAATVWAICIMYALTAAMGFATMTRSHVSSHNEHQAEKIKAKKDSFEQAKSKYLAANEELQTMKGNERYKSTAGCSVPENRMTVASRYFCTDFRTKKEEVDLKETKYKEAMTNVPKDEFVVDSDPQMTFFAQMSGVSKNLLLQYWALALAVVIEMISALGNYAVSPSRMAPVKVSYGRTKAQPASSIKKRGRPPGSKNKPKLRVVA